MELIFVGRNLERLFETIGRRDMPAYLFAGDLETCFQAFRIARRGDLHGGLPDEVESDLVEAERLSRGLCAILQRLPGDVSRLIDLHVLSEGAYRRIDADVEDIKVPLADLAAAVEGVRREATSKRMGIVELEDRLFAAIASAFRNRLRIVPTAEKTGKFMPVLAGILEMARGAEPLVQSACDRATPGHIADLLTYRVVRPEPDTRLELVGETENLVLAPQAKGPPPFVIPG